LLAHGRWFSPGTPASSTTKTGRHDIAESSIKTPKSNQNQIFPTCIPYPFLAHLAFAYAITWHPLSVKFSHFNLL
jgi:hypothetical protein